MDKSGLTSILSVVSSTHQPTHLFSFTAGKTRLHPLQTSSERSALTSMVFVTSSSHWHLYIFQTGKRLGLLSQSRTSSNQHGIDLFQQQNRHGGNILHRYKGKGLHFILLLSLRSSSNQHGIYWVLLHIRQGRVTSCTDFRQGKFWAYFRALCKVLLVFTLWDIDGGVHDGTLFSQLSLLELFQFSICHLP